MQTAPAIKAKKAETNTEITIIANKKRYVITQPDGKIRLEMHPEGVRAATDTESYISNLSTSEIQNFLDALLLHGFFPSTLKEAKQHMETTRISPKRPVAIADGKVIVELSFSIIEPGDGACVPDNVRKYSVNTRDGQYVSTFNNYRRSAEPREVKLIDIPVIYRFLTTTENLPERAIIP